MRLRTRFIAISLMSVFSSHETLLGSEETEPGTRDAPFIRRETKSMERLGEKGIAVRQGTHAVHTLGYYQKKYGLKS